MESGKGFFWGDKVCLKGSLPGPRMGPDGEAWRQGISERQIWAALADMRRRRVWGRIMLQLRDGKSVLMTREETVVGEGPDTGR